MISKGYNPGGQRIAQGGLISDVPVHSITLMSSDGTVWDITIGTTGILTMTPRAGVIAIISPSWYSFLMQSPDGTTWRITINNDGSFTKTPLGIASPGLLSFTLIDANGVPWKTTISNDGEFVSATDIGLLVLQSPDGSIWTLTINNAGILSGTKP